MEATSAGLTTGTLGAFTVVHGAADQIELTGATTNLASGAARVLTATIQDAAGNTVTSDNSTVVSFAKASGAGTVTGTGNDTAVAGVASKTITGDLVGSVTMEATSAGLTTGTLGAFTVVHGAAADIVLTGATDQPDLRRHPRPHRDAEGRRRQHRDLRQLDRRRLRQGLRRRHRHRHRHRHRRRGRRHEDRHRRARRLRTMEATSAGLTTGSLGAFTVVHGAAADIVLTGATTNLTSGANRVLTATIKDAAGNTVTSDNSTVVTFTKASGAGTVTGTGNDTAVAGVATKTITGALIGSVTMEAASRGPDDRHAWRLHRRPRRRHPDLADGRDHQPHLRRHARPHRDDPGRGRQHRHQRQQHRRRLHQGLGRRHRHRHRKRHRHRAASPPRRSPARSSAR